MGVALAGEGEFQHLFSEKKALGKPIHFSVEKKMPSILVTGGKNTPLTMVVQIPLLQAVRRIIGVMKLALPSGGGP